MGHHTKKSSIIWGLLILAAGALLFAFNMGLLPLEYKHVAFSWPMILVVIGFSMLFSRHSWFGGIILMLIGGFFILPKLNIEGLDFMVRNGWAMGLMIGGVLIICKTLFGKHFFHQFSGKFHNNAKWKEKHHSHNWKNSGNASGFIERNCVFGGGKEQLNIKEFNGGDINCVFGGIELDLTDSELAEGVHILEINSVFGGCVLYLPIEWNIEMRPNHVFGQFVDNRPKPSFEVDEKRKLIIEVNAVFGGGEIKCREV